MAAEKPKNRTGNYKGTKHRHAFRFKIGEGNIITVWAKVKKATKDVYLPLRADHVRESIRLRGVGNTQTCSMAVCATREKDNFPHPVAKGYIDWFYSRAFIVSKCDKNGMPSECYEYLHSDSIAQLNDTKGGQQKLLAQLEGNGGERIIHLRPIRLKDSRDRSPPKGTRNGSRTRVLHARGAKLRFAVAEAGGVPK